MKKLFLVTTTILISGCASKQINSFDGVREANHTMVKACEFLGNVNGSSMIPGPDYVYRCKKDAFTKASKIGATHILWLSTDNQASGQAYKCL
ncbi:hypothetical protein [Bacterioplanoides sp. SCSIO 12839]|uniref:hypothetical protein n=1 Tax=Bacterioplanoides sp. SCSIO 12839 TaxID=2829569 RepID=UPI00210762A6|nr:hypothetical protein [Bacterioplanoides sp. SCSIO 12839]UTW48679.1 hypothetical protein KFF03_01880 [Bacterioplanoides sp. SCSIO 12839]